MNLEKVFQTAAVILVGVAAFFLWKNNNDGLFVAAVGGAVSFFLSIRFQVKDRLSEREKAQLAADQTEG
ncbi:MAG: hypothetical protein M3T96_10060 [Acidobacteriota bacterium]|nr:hypothetical protein [Acidobacteriota bacterium]